MITQVHQAMPERAISQLCETLQVSRSWYYEKQTRVEEEEADVELRDTIERIILDFPGYGYRRVTHALKRAGWIINHKRVLRIAGIVDQYGINIAQRHVHPGERAADQVQADDLSQGRGANVDQSSKRSPGGAHHQGHGHDLPAGRLGHEGVQL